MIEFLVFLILLAATVQNQTESQTYEITRTWNNKTTDVKISITLISKIYNDRNRTNQSQMKYEEGLEIVVRAPFFNDPQVPPSIPPGTVDKLWQYEVVEVFLVGEAGNYLEIELAPRGHYLLLELDGERNVLKYGLPLPRYETRFNYSSSDNKLPGSGSSGSGAAGIATTEWEGRALVPFHYLPKNITKFNAYAIHKSDKDRVFMSLFPVPSDSYPHPDFHLLEYFQPISIRVPN